MNWNETIKKTSTNWYRSGKMNKTAQLMPHNRQHFHLSQSQNSKKLECFDSHFALLNQNEILTLDLIE